ncbi:14135_t:CDS:2, partial [Entrophospora sp. SA101]
MSRSKDYPVSLISVGSLKENLHFGDFSQNWWETRQSNNSNDIDNISILYPIRIGMETMVILNETRFFITVVQGCEGSLYQPGYICEVNGKKSEVFSNSSAAITNTYQELFSSKSKFSGPLIMGHNKSKINEQILADITFYPFNCMFSNIKLFVYGIGAFTKDHLDNTGPGFKSSFVYLIGAKKIKTLFVQEINEKNSSVKMYQNYNLVFTYIGNSPNNVWEKVGILSQHKGIDLFGITSPQVQSYIQKFRVPKCLPEEWIIEEKMKPLWEYHLRRFTLASTPWNEFFTKCNPEADCNNLQFLYDSAFLKPIPKQYCREPVVYLKNTKRALWEKFKYSFPNGIKRTTFYTKLMGNQYVYREDLGGLCSICSSYGYETFENIMNLIKEKINNMELQISLAIKRYVRVGGEIQEGNDITSAIENTAGTSVAHIELNREGENAGYIQARGIPNIGRWTTFSPAQIQNITKNEISQPSPQVSEPTKPKSPWKIPLPHASGICPKRLALPELKNELTNRGIVYDNQNKRQKLIEMLDKELSQETLANVE